MSNLLENLQERGLIQIPSWLTTNVQYMAIVGSHAYGVADTSVRDKIPDYDIYGWCIPPKAMIFPHITGHIQGFGPGPQSFDQYQQHHVMDQEANGGNGKEWDFSIFGIVKYFELCRENNPNMLDSLFVPETSIIHCTTIGRMVRDSRKLFLSKLCWKKFRGYASQQLHKMENKNPLGKRKEIVDKHGFDTKFAYHIIRLYDQVEQIMLEGDMDLQRAKETMKAIRRGDWKENQIKDWAMEKEKALEVAYTNCKLPEKPDIGPLKTLLLQCLEQQYGSLDNCVNTTGWAEQTLRDVDKLLDAVRTKMYN